MSTKTTYKQTELGLIPDDWEVKKFEDFADKSIKWAITGGPFGSDLKSSDYTHAGVRIIQLQNIGDGKFLDDYKIYTSVEKANQLLSCNIYPGEIILSKMGDPVARACFIPEIEERFVMASDGIRLVVNEKNYNKKFVHDYINSIYFRKSAIEVSTGSTRQRIGLPILKNIKILTPPLPEQKKIADCLSTWDIAIEKQSQLINALTDRKKALMQQLLTGKKRLPGFEGKWNLNSINDLFIFKNGKAHENDIDENGKYILVNSKFISTDGEILKKTNSNLAPLEVNDLVFVMSDVPNGKALAKFFLIKEDNLYTLNQRIGLLKIKKGNPIFMYYLLNRNAYFLMFDNGVGQTNLRKDDILDCPLNIPSLSEQTAIAEILATADRELTLQKEKLAQLQTLKKGLMQVLLTGKKRLIN